MENKIGNVQLTEREREAVVKELAALDARVAKVADVHLDPQDRRSILKMRPGGEKQIPLIARLATERGVVIPTMSVDGMNADLEIAQSLRVLLSAADSLRQRIEDGVLEAEAECWSAATAFYSVLSSMAARDPQLANALRPATDFFATGRRRPKPAPTLKP